LLGSLPVRDTYRLDLGKPAAGLATETFERVFDQDALVAAIDAYLQQVRPVAASRESLIQQLNVRDRATYVIDMKTGWMVSGEATREAGPHKGEPLEVVVTKLRRK